MEKAATDWPVALETCETFRVKLLTNGRHNCLLIAIKHTTIYPMVFDYNLPIPAYLLNLSEHTNIGTESQKFPSRNVTYVNRLMVNSN